MGPLLVNRTPTKNVANLVYVAYVGQHDKHMLFKYGKTHNICNRIKDHKKHFDTFDLEFLEYTDNKDVVERLLRKDLQHMGIHRSLVINNKKQTELFCLQDKRKLVDIRIRLKEIVRDNPTLLQQTLCSYIEYQNTYISYLEGMLES